MLVNSYDEYEAIIAGIQSETAVDALRAKEALVVKYFKEAFDMDFYALREQAEINTDAILN
ncbi:hypothetical protein D3C72_2428590 [compost metagenome]